VINRNTCQYYIILY